MKHRGISSDIKQETSRHYKVVIHVSSNSVFNDIRVPLNTFYPICLRSGCACFIFAIRLNLWVISALKTVLVLGLVPTSSSLY